MSQDMEAMIRKILEDMQKGTPSPVSAVAQTSTTEHVATVADYPIAKNILNGLKWAIVP